MKLLILLISFPIFSQSTIDSSVDFIYVDNKSIDDIISVKYDYVRPILYKNTPNFSKLPVDKKKAKFIDFILPSVLIEKDIIKQAYNYVIENFDSIYIHEKTKYLYDYCDCITKNELLLCLKEQPNSIIIAQAAIESGWGTSRFFLEGKNLFGVHTNSNDINKLEANNSSLVFVKKYKNISESISHYLRTLAKGYAYQEYRINRFSNIMPEDLIQFLDIYSERRSLYVDDLKEIIEYNNLTIYDSLKLKYD